MAEKNIIPFFTTSVMQIQLDLDKMKAKLEANPRLNELFRAIKERHKQTLKELQASN